MQTNYSTISSRRVRQPDGTCYTHCRLCQRPLQRAPKGVSFVTCIDCLEGKTPVDRLPIQDTTVQSLYTEAELAEIGPEDKVGLIRTIFRAISTLVVRTKKEKPPSAKVAKQKQRKPLFAPRADSEKPVVEEDDE